MFEGLRRLLARYPRQVWLLFGGEAVSTIGRAMVYPFFTLYLNTHLGLPLTSAGLVLALFAVGGAVGEAIGGALADRYGRKWVMAFSLSISVVATLGLVFVRTLAQVAVLSAAFGLLSAFYDPASSAMVADLVPERDRNEAYSVWRVMANAGLAIGPAAGGFLAARSYDIAFAASALGSLAFLLLVVLGMRETRPANLSPTADAPARAGYRQILQNRAFSVFLLLFTLAYMVYSTVLVVMPVYMQDQFGLGPEYFGLLMSVNALIVVFLQFPMIRLVRRYNNLHILATGVALAALAVGGVAFAARFGGFLLVIIVLSLGENLFVPTATTETAELSPPELRGRYMGALGLAWIIGWGGAPVFAGVVGNVLGPRNVWLVAGVLGLFFAVGLALLANATRRDISS